MMRKYAAFFPFAFLLFILESCNFFVPQPIPDLDKVELTAGPDVNVAASATTATVTFTGAAGLTLTNADFTVTEGGYISNVSAVSGDGTVSVTVTLQKNTGQDKIYRVNIAADSATIKGSAGVIIIQGADPRVELTAGLDVNVAASATTATVTFFTGAAGLTLTNADFTVSTGTIGTPRVNGGIVSVPVTFAANTTGKEKTYTVRTAQSSVKIKGSASVTITQESLPTFARPGSGTKAYTLARYDPAAGVAVLKDYGSSGAGTQYVVTDTNLKALFNAIYTPNAPGTTDSVELDDLADPKPPKATFSYTAKISEKVLGLFKITVGSSAIDDKVEITGDDSDLPIEPGASNVYLIIIDIGLPDRTDNSGLPTFYIPDRELGAETGDYAHIRLRVNRGASLVILADNSDYINGGAGHSCPDGYFNNGCVEVMAGGKLRDGAYEGFPLGSNAVILNRLGSYLAVGPETTFNAIQTPDLYYAGWLIGPDSTNEAEKPRIKWDISTDPSGYLEVRPGKLAISANVTVQKGLGLIYSVWFIGDTTVTINVPDTESAKSGLPYPGLFANGDNYKFYGTTDKAQIDIMPGSVLHKMFLTLGAKDTGNFIDTTSLKIEIKNKGSGAAEAYTNNITGYSTWTRENADIN
jgi:hypothetical protein